MFTGIRQAILPLALRRLHRKDDLQRACLLIETLARHWRDRQPLQLLIVAPARDEHFIRARLPMLPGVTVTVRPESDFFSPFSRFFMLTGWFRQQIVKLYVPSRLGFAGYLTLDSDVVCVGDFDSMTFVRDGRALSRWEPKGHHDWWQRAARMAGVPYDPNAHGLSVTPNILHGDLATQALAHFHSGAVDAVTTLGVEVIRRLGTIPWTEYSLYTSVAERNGNLFDYHVHWDPCYYSATQLVSERSCVWQAGDFERLARLSRGTDPGGKFIIVQSHARIPVEQVRAYCLGFAA
ncbi:MAG TPA: DUF6492 family protein [Reyranella sp.]|jgi:hypothetical protein|nr:DUF6492 family protein [Reyranella sp.]